jgi:hypothetical protein
MAPATRRIRLERILVKRFGMVYVKSMIFRENWQVWIKVRKGGTGRRAG